MFTKTRLLILAILVLLVTNAVTIIFLVRSQNENSSIINAYPFIDISRNFISQENFIVNIQPLRESLQQIVAEAGPDSISVYFEYLNTGANIQINNDLRFYPASLVKIPTALAVMKKVEKGTWKLDDKLVLFDPDKDSRYGNLYKEQTGTLFTIETLLKELLINSDNTAHRILIRNLSEEELGEVRDEIGLSDLFDENLDVSAKEYSRLFRALYISSFLRRENSQKILQWLAETPFHQSLEAGVPEEVIYAHKIGEDREGSTYLDSGIVYLPNRPYLLTIMIGKHNKEEAQEIMKKVSGSVYEYVNSY